MRTRILTPKERQAIEKYLKADGEKPGLVRTLAQRVRKNLPQLHRELALIERFHKAYVGKYGKRTEPN